jgi:hypothetical protein
LGAIIAAFWKFCGTWQTGLVPHIALRRGTQVGTSAGPASRTQTPRLESTVIIQSSEKERRTASDGQAPGGVGIFPSMFALSFERNGRYSVEKPRGRRMHLLLP